MKSVDVLVVARRGPWREAILCLLADAARRPTVAIAATGLSALAAGRAQPPRLVLIAYDEAEEDVLELIRLLRAALPQPPCLVVAYTQAQIDRACAAGAAAGLHYTASAEEFAALIDRWLA